MAMVWTLSGTEIQINNTVTAETTEHHVVTYNANGLITGGACYYSKRSSCCNQSSARALYIPGSGIVC